MKYRIARNFGEFGEFLKFAKFNPPIFKNNYLKGLEDLIRQSFTRQNAAGANSPKFSSAKVSHYTVIAWLIGF